MAVNQPQQLVNAELIEHKLYRAIYSNRQLEEVLVDFWINHFNVFNGKGPGSRAAHQLRARRDPSACLRTLQGHAARDRASSRDALLSRQLAIAGASRRPSASRRPGVRGPGLNENYGRELLELHTLGVDGGYTQDDVIAVARAFTGWTIYDPQQVRRVSVQSGECTTGRKRSSSVTRFPRWAASRTACR